MMRLDNPTWERLESLSTHFGKSIAEVIRQLVAQVEVDDFPQHWQVAVKEPQQRQGGKVDARRGGKRSP